MKHGPGSWAPLLEGESAARALAAAEAIAHDLSGSSLPGLGSSLSGGQIGLALLYAYLERSLGHPEAGDHAGRHLDGAIARLAEQPPVPPSLYHGFAGVAWAVEHLAAGGTAAGDEDPEDLNEGIDAALMSVLRRSPWRGEFDLLSGLVGWGVYALERLPHSSAAELLALVVARLAECAEPGASGKIWRSPRPNAPQEPDPGMAHGAAGVIALLARILQESTPGPEVAALLTAAVDGVLALPREGEGDLAWCAGEAGLSAALLAAGRACHRDDWERAALRLAAAAAERFPDRAGSFDPALCHGTAGLSHLFHRLYRATGDPALLAAAHRWLERTLARQVPGQGVGGYLCRSRQADGRFAWIAEPGFLGGAAGIGLALLAAATPVEPAWDRLLLLSGRAQGSCN